MPIQLPSIAGPAACSRCGAPLGPERRLATGLDGAMVCEPCQHAELDELLEQLEHVSPGPALPANSISIEARARLREQASGGG